MNKIKLAIPKGRLYEEVKILLQEAGFLIKSNERSYRPYINDPEIEIKLFKPQNIPKLVELGSRDIAFTGYDWIIEENVNVKEILDLKFDPVRIVSAIPKDINPKELKKNLD